MSSVSNTKVLSPTSKSLSINQKKYILSQHSSYLSLFIILAGQTFTAPWFLEICTGLGRVFFSPPFAPLVRDADREQVPRGSAFGEEVEEELCVCWERGENVEHGRDAL